MDEGALFAPCVFCHGLLMDLSKAFDNVNHDLLIARLNAYGLDMDALKPIKSYLSKSHQRVKLNSSFSSYGKKFKLEFLKVWSWGLYFSMYS